MPTPPAPPNAIPEPALPCGTYGTVSAANDLEAERLGFREILERMPDHVLLLDRDGRIAYVNPALARDLAIPAESLTGRPLEELEVAAPEFESVRRELYRVLEVDEPLAGERTATGPTGPRTYSYTMTPLTGPDGRVTAVMLTSRDVTPLTEAQTALAESETKYRHLVELAPDAILIHQDGVIVFANPAAVVLLGAAGHEDLVGRSALGIVHPGSRDSVEWSIAADLRGEESPVTAVDLLRADGTAVTVQGRGAMIPFGGRPAVQVVLRDVTEEKRTEAALRESEAKYRRMVDDDITGNFISTPDGRLLDCNPAFVRMFGFASFEEALAADIRDLYDAPDERPALLHRLRRKRRLENEERFRRRRDGTRIHVVENMIGDFDDDGTLVQIRGYISDDTQRYRAEAELKEREQTLQGIFRAAPVGIGMVSHRRITQANDQLCRMTGYSRDELVGRDARLFYPDEETYAYVGREKYAQIMADGIGAVETQWRTKDGATLDILLSSSPVDLTRPREDVVFSALDITKLRESERVLGTYMDDLQRSNEELQRFAYVASHDLQEPLRSIISFSQLLERRYKGELGEDADEFIGFIIEGGNRMQRLIEDLLQLSRIETTAKPLVPTDVGEVVADALRLMETSIREAGATVEVGDLPVVMADAAQLGQVFTNLVGNALKYRRPDVPPEVRISAERAGRFWRFAVADNGIGIEAEYFGRIFEMFRRLHTKEQYEGTGIGLAVVKKIVERHGGRVRVESALDEGSTFYFTLPAA